jgi:hypothetical protein
VFISRFTREPSHKSWAEDRIDTFGSGGYRTADDNAHAKESVDDPRETAGRLSRLSDARLRGEGGYRPRIADQLQNSGPETNKGLHQLSPANP